MSAYLWGMWAVVHRGADGLERWWNYSCPLEAAAKYDEIVEGGISAVLLHREFDPVPREDRVEIVRQHGDVSFPDLDNERDPREFITRRTLVNKQ